MHSLIVGKACFPKNPDNQLFLSMIRDLWGVDDINKIVPIRNVNRILFHTSML